MGEERAKESQHISEEENKMGKLGSYTPENLPEVIKDQIRYLHGGRQTDPWTKWRVQEVTHSHRDS